MKEGRCRARLAVLVLVVMLSSIVPVQAQGARTHSLSPVLDEALGSPLYENLLAKDIEKLESTGSSGTKVTGRQAARVALQGKEQNACAAPGIKGCNHSTQKECADHCARQAGMSSTPMILDTTPIASSNGSVQSNVSRTHEDYDSPIYAASLASSINKLERTPMSVARSRSA